MSKKTLPVGITLIVGILVVIDYFLKIAGTKTIVSALKSWGVIVSTFSVGIGALNLLSLHVRRAKSQKPERLESIILVVGLIVATAVCSVSGPSSSSTMFIYDSIIAPVMISIYSMLALYIGSAAYRAFRVRNLDSSVLLFVATLVLLGQLPAASVMFPWLLEPVNWIMNILNVAGQRGIIIGSGIALLSLSLRVILGIDRSYIAQGQE